jgi:hypothetical protein
MKGRTYHLSAVSTKAHQLLLMQTQLEWNETKSLDTTASNGPIVPASDVRWIWSTGWMITGWRKSKCSEKPAPVPLNPPVPHKLYWDWTQASEVRSQQLPTELWNGLCNNNSPNIILWGFITHHISLILLWVMIISFGRWSTSCRFKDTVVIQVASKTVLQVTHKKKKKPWLWSASELCRSSDRRLLAK